MVKIKQLRQEVRHFKYESREMKISALKRDFRRLTIAARLDSERMPENPEKLLETLALPEDYKKVISFLGICSPKTRRIADRCLDLWVQLDSREYISILKKSFFNEANCLKTTNLDILFSEFHQALLEETSRVNKEQREWIPWEKVKGQLDKKKK